MSAAAPAWPGSPALFRAFPELAERLPRYPCVVGPTPVEPLPLDGLPAGALWVKRDDRCCPLYGGNKPRKLEFILGAARAQHARRLVTTGGLGTHHGLATTILGHAAGLATTLVLVDQPVTPEVKRSLLLDAAYGAELVHGGNVPGAALQVARVLARSTARRERPFLVASGGSSLRGDVGMVSAGLELAEQIRGGLLPEPAELACAVGTGGTHVGLVVGLRLAGLSTRVRGVLVTDILPPSPRRLASTARSLVRLLRRASSRVPRVALSAGEFELDREQLGAGYGASTPAAQEAVAAAADCGLAVETTYTGKCLAALRERARRGDLPGGPVLFWNTFNSVDVVAAAPRPPDPALLPERFRTFLTAHEVTTGRRNSGGRRSR